MKQCNTCQHFKQFPIDDSYFGSIGYGECKHDDSWPSKPRSLRDGARDGKDCPMWDAARKQQKESE